MNLTKEQAISLFVTKARLSRALGISRSAVGQWPDKLDERRTNEVIGAAVRHGIALPDGFVAPAEQVAA